MSRRSPAPAAAAPRQDWKAYRPAIWLAMIGIAVMLLVVPFYIGAVPLGAAIGVAIHVYRRRPR
jgi:hypothetical protein